jgi:hypothetical protein
MKSKDLLLIGLVGGVLYYLYNKKPSDSAMNDTPIGGGSYNPTPTVFNTPPNGKTQYIYVDSVQKGIDAINTSSNLSSGGMTLVKSNTLFTDGNSTYKTGSNQTVQKLPSYSSPVVLSVNPVSRNSIGQSAMDKAISARTGKTMIGGIYK